MSFLKSKSPQVIILVAITLLVGCSNLGPNAIRMSRNDYNIVIEQTNNEQLLLNLVRLRYRDTPLFIETTSISTSFAFGANINASASLVPSVADKYGVSSGLSYVERPTITYAPLQGQKFVKQILTPLNPQILLLLYHSGWSSDRLMRIVVQSLNGIPNAPTASGPTPDKAPEYERFNKVSALMRRLQQSRSIILAADKAGKELVLKIVPERHQSSDVQAFLQALNLDKETLQFPVVSSLRKSKKAIVMTTRSLMASMFYLSQAVEVPQRDRDAGKVTVTQHESGEFFDWHDVTYDLFRIRTSSSRPSSPYVAINYRGAWFYIEDNDLTSKSSFSLLKQLLALQSGEQKYYTPVLTIPITP